MIPLLVIWLVSFLMSNLPYVVVAVFVVLMCKALHRSRRDGTSLRSEGHRILGRGITNFWRWYRSAALIMASVCGYAYGLWGVWEVTAVIYVCIAWVWLASRRPKVQSEVA